MEDPLESVNAEGWHPQDVILICQALDNFAKDEELGEARSARGYALLFGLIDSADISFEHTDFSDYDHLSDGSSTALTQWMENQTDESWGENLIPDE